MSILKNLFAAVGAVTLGAVAVGIVLGATPAMTAERAGRSGPSCSMPEEKDKNGEKKASDADATKVEKNPTEKAEEPETSAEAEEDKAEKQ